MFKQLIIGAAILGLSTGGAFAAGAVYGQQQAGDRRTAGLAPTGPGQTMQAPGAAGTVGTVGTVGAVSRVDGRNVYLRGPDGKETRVTVPEGTRIEKPAEGSLDDLRPGSRVMVQTQGAPAADGSLTATQVSLLPEGAASFAGPPAGNAGATGGAGSPGTTVFGPAVQGAGR